MTTNNRFRLMAGTAAVALAFNAGTVSAGSFLDTSDSFILANAKMSQTLTKAAPNDEAPSIRSGGFMHTLEETMKSPADKVRIVDYPPRANRELLRVTAVVPPAGFESQPIPVCAEQNNKVLGTWVIKNSGDVVPVTGTWAKETTTSTACKEFIIAARDAFNAKLAQPNAPSQPPPGSSKQASAATGGPNI